MDAALQCLATGPRFASAVTLFLCLGVSLIAPRGFAADEPELTPALAKLAADYAQVEAWEGVFRRSLQANSSDATPVAKLKAYDRQLSYGTFRLERGQGSMNLTRGILSWKGNGTFHVEGEHGNSSWQWNGIGGEDHYSYKGDASNQWMEFNFWLPTNEVTLNTGIPADAKSSSIPGEKRVMGVWDESRGGHSVRRTLDETSSAPHSPYLWVDPEDGLRFGQPAEGRKMSVVRQGPGVLNFTYDGPGDSSALQYVQAQVHSRVTLFPVYDDLEVEVTIKNYEKWFPRGNLTAPDQPGATVEIQAKLVSKKPGSKSLPKAKFFRFYLEDASREPGVCMNWPRFGANGDAPPPKDPKPDLRFNPAGGATLTNEDLTAEVLPLLAKVGGADTTGAQAQVDCYDFGGYADLRVICKLEDGREIVGVLQGPGEKLRMIPLPWRTGGSKIAQVWKDRVKVVGGDAADLDETPVGDGNAGDGFSNYEEYRGFAEQGDHLRTKPSQKDIFVLNTLGQKAKNGIYLFTDISGLQAHYGLRPDEMPESRRMNANRSADSPRSCAEDQYQHGLILDQVAVGAYSFADIPGQLFRPQQAKRVRVLALLFEPGRENELDSTIAHELLHACGVHHHGEADNRVAWVRKQRIVNGQEESWFEERPARWDSANGAYISSSLPGTRVRIFNEQGEEILPVAGSPFDQPAITFLGQYHQQHSGDVDCVMRYHCAQAFVLPGRPRDRFLSPGEPVGMGLCASADGTRFNAPGADLFDQARYDRSTRGDCSHQICVRDDAPDRSAPAATP